MEGKFVVPVGVLMLLMSLLIALVWSLFIAVFLVYWMRMPR
jgi:hypothetical protein